MRDIKNSVQLLGNVGGEVKTGQTGSGVNWANFSLATSEKYVDKTGGNQEKTEWHFIGCFGKLSEIVAKYVKKGSKVLVEGKLSSREYTKEDGTIVKSWSIVANDVVFLNDSTAKKEDAPIGDKLPF
jgi:single-strand DNA-binding protein